MFGKEIGDSHCVLRMPTHPPWKGAHAAQDQPTIERRGDRPTFVLNGADALKKIVLHFGNNNSSEDVTMTAEIFCRVMQDKIRAQIEWALERWRPGIITNTDRTRRVDNLCNR